MNAPLGYDPAFLGGVVDLPQPCDDRAVSTLDYPHFSVRQDPVRRLAVVTAVNIDGERLVSLPRRGDWRLDDRIPDGWQAGPAIYVNNDLDRGHLVRRRDPGWGAPRDADAAMRATFVYTNAAPQAAGFNQSPELWLGLEDHVLAYARTFGHRVSVFTAPVLAADDPPYRGIQVPRWFWKVVAWAEADRLKSAAFLLDQSTLISLVDDRFRVSPIGGFLTFQVPVAEVAELASVDLGPLAAADVLAPLDALRDGIRLLRVPDDIFLGEPRETETSG